MRVRAMPTRGFDVEGALQGPRPSRDLDVLIVLSSLCAEGTPIMALDLCRLWRNEGREVAVATLFDEPDELRAEFLAGGVPLVRVQAGRRGVRRYLDLVTRFRAICGDLRPRGLLSMPLGWHAFMALGAKLAGVRRVVAHVGNHPQGTGMAFRKFLAEVQLGRPFTDRLVCCSEYVREGVCRRFHVPARSTAVVYNGSDVHGTAMRAARARVASPHGALRVGMVARLEQHKDQDTLIEAVALLARQQPVELSLVGDGSRRGQLEALVSARGLEAQVRFLGARRDIPELLGAFDVFAFSAKPDEGLGIALIEAMSAGVPIVATDVGACRETLEAGALGKLVPYRDAASMARALSEVAAGGQEVRDRAERAAAAARARVSMEAMAAGYARELGLDVA